MSCSPPHLQHLQLVKKGVLGRWNRPNSRWCLRMDLGNRTVRATPQLRLPFQMRRRWTRRLPNTATQIPPNSMNHQVFFRYHLVSSLTLSVILHFFPHSLSSNHFSSLWLLHLRFPSNYFIVFRRIAFYWIPTETNSCWSWRFLFFPTSLSCTNFPIISKRIFGIENSFRSSKF